MTDMPEPVFRVCTRTDWDRAIAAGVLGAEGIDKADGFIHLSTGEQLWGTLEAHYGEGRNLVALTIDPATLGSGLRWEASRAGQLFPHLYAPLPATAVGAVTPLPDDPVARARTVDLLTKSAGPQSAGR